MIHSRKRKLHQPAGSLQRQPGQSLFKKEWHPFGGAIILISIIIAILIGFWFIL